MEEITWSLLGLLAVILGLLIEILITLRIRKLRDEMDYKCPHGYDYSDNCPDCRH